MTKVGTSEKVEIKGVEEKEFNVLGAHINGDVFGGGG